MLELKPNTIQPMKHLHTIMIVAVLHMSTMCTTESVVLGVTTPRRDKRASRFDNEEIKRERRKSGDSLDSTASLLVPDNTVFSDDDSSSASIVFHSRRQEELPLPDNTVFSDDDSSSASIVFHSRRQEERHRTYSDNEPIRNTPSRTRRGSIPSRYPLSPRDYLDSGSESIHTRQQKTPPRTTYIKTRDCLPYDRRDNNGWQEDWSSCSEINATITPRERKDLREEKIPTCSDNEASASKRRTPRTRNLFEIFISPRHTIEDSMGHLRKNVLYPMAGPRTRRSLSNVSDELRRDVELEEKCAELLIERMTQKGCYERLFDKDPDGFVVQWIAENETREVKHNVTCQLYRQPRETVQAWLKKAPRNLFLDGQGQFTQKFIDVMKDAVEEDYRNLRWFLERFCTCKRDYNACRLQFTEIIKKAIENNHRALQYVDPNVCGQDYPLIMRLAEQQSLRAPMYVHENLGGQDYIDIMAQFFSVHRITIFRSRDRQLCEDYYDSAAHLVRIAPRLIRYVSIFNLNEYYHAAKIAVEADPKAIKYVELISGYPESCRSYCEAACIALERDYSVFNDVNKNVLTHRQRKRLCTTYCKAAEKALKKDFRCFEYINKNVLTEGQYRDICKAYCKGACIALKKDFRCFEYINKDVLTEEQYRDICKAYYKAAEKALKKDFRCFEYINKDVLTYRQRKRLYDTYYEAAKKALEKNYRVFNDINKNVLTYRQRKRLREKHTQYRHISRKRHKSRR